jgi:hypothetical protein
MELLLSLAEAGHAEAAGERVQHEWRQSPPSPHSRWTGIGLPASCHLWTLQHDDPERNAVVYRAHLLEGVIRDEIRQGLPFAPGARERVAVLDPVRLATDFRADEFRFADPAELVAALRAAATMKRAGAAARRVGRDDWGSVVRADREEPLPGYARWALAIRPDCPAWARAGFDTHPAFAQKLRKAGIHDCPRHLLETCRPAIHALDALHHGLGAFPGRREAIGPLRRLVRGTLGADTGAWARLAHLLPEFGGTVPELFDVVRARQLKRR